ncbi:ATP-binding protein [Brevundimonas lutea]|uniref:ATP-binding protein n=1 Tax=Brevundimonas lutea TaxID=2293980 RepID=UPI000F023457|nr:ATP-binding protein [Brevundimonas lutea]
MKFLILRPLQQSELGMFHAYRRSGRETSRQRAINFDGDVVDRVFPTAADTDRIALELTYDTDEGPRCLEHSLKRQAKNWRLEGNCPTDAVYDFVEPDCLFALQVDAGIQPARGAWVVFAKDDPTAIAIMADGSTSGLMRAGMIALQPDEAPRVHHLLAQARPDMFTPPASQDFSMTDSSTHDAEGTAAPTEPGRRRLPPKADRLANILGSAGHSLVSAVADLIDNAISADASEIHITFGQPNGGQGRWMTIRDNGRGMSAQQLDEALTVGGDADYGPRSLGKFGFGLKGASWSQARKFMVVTRQAGGEVRHLGWDTTDMADFAVDDRPLEEWEKAITDPGEKGTVILWKDMKAPVAVPTVRGVPPFVAEIQDLSRHLGLVFHRFLDGDAKGRPPLKIWVNEISVASNGPASHPLTQHYDVKTLDVPYDQGTAPVRVAPILLPHEDELRQRHGDGWQAQADRIGYWGKRNETQGLFLYRNDRLIRWGGWHDMWATSDEKTKLARVILDIDPALDEPFNIDISKQKVQLPPFLQSRIKPLADDVRKASKAKFGRNARPPVPPAPPVPAPPGVAEGPVTGGPSAPPSPSPSPTPEPSPPGPTPIAVRKVTSTKFAWKLAEDLKGDRTLQVGDVSEPLVRLASAIGTDPAAVDALAAFLTELDGVDAQQSLVGTPDDA